MLLWHYVLMYVTREKATIMIIITCTCLECIFMFDKNYLHFLLYRLHQFMLSHYLVKPQTRMKNRIFTDFWDFYTCMLTKKAQMYILINIGPHNLLYFVTKILKKRQFSKNEVFEHFQIKMRCYFVSEPTIDVTFFGQIFLLFTPVFMYLRTAKASMQQYNFT